MLYWFCRNLSKFFLSISFRIQYEGVENQPAKGGYIVACNHSNLLDPFFLVFGIKRQVHFMAKAELFRLPVLGSIVRSVGTFPVERGKGDTSAVDYSIQLLREGRLLGIFPEGTRSKDGKLGKPKTGVALIAQQAQAGVLPCAICYPEKLRFRSHITVRYGEILPIEALGLQEEGFAALKRGSKLVFEHIARLLGESTHDS